MNSTESTPQDQDTILRRLLLPARIPDSPPPVPDPELRAAVWRLVVEIGGEQRIIDVQLTDQINIGRSDPTQGYVADLDLTAASGRSAGVSRRHATIYLANDVLHIRDLGSANGTLVNGVRLEPQHLYRLHEGDKISVGQLDLLVVSARPRP
jgi:pSer/pThr/pTyr-binding forkhead associated (FHA) protein